jgi:hypothetical protein
MADMSGSGSRFAVDLGDIRLPDLVEKQVESEIQGIVLRVLASSDFRGDRRLQGSIFHHFPGHTLGLWLEPIEADIPPTEGTGWSGSDSPLTVKDHTTIVKTVMEHPFEVIRNLDHAPSAPKPSPQEVLEATLLVNGIDAYVKGRIRVALELLPMLEDGEARAPASLKRELKAIERKLAKVSREKQTEALWALADQYRAKDEDGLAVGLTTAAQILQDGADTIYAPGSEFYETLAGGQTSVIADKEKGTVETIETIDKFGAIAGGGVGAFIGGVGAGPGAAVMGLGASAGATLAAVWEWFWD